jgi:catechol 2,3-dioxygenase-like lactoylglutathione lyase family enzyme
MLTSMGFHHIALATRDAAATHDFYTRVMGFELVKVVVAPTPPEPQTLASGRPHEGWAKHFFYDTRSATGAGADDDSGMIAFWEIHDEAISDFDADINRAAGTPWWVNHFAFNAPTLEVLHERRDHWRRCGYGVLEVDHEFCVSIYLRDPSGNMMEFCHDRRAFTDDERSRAAAVLSDPSPTFDASADATFWPPITDHEPVPTGTT